VEIAREDLAPSDFIEDMEAMKENLLEEALDALTAK